MKKIYPIILTTLMFCNVSFAQSEQLMVNDNVDLPAIKIENHIIDLYYAVPFKGIIIRAIEIMPDVYSYKTTIAGPIGIRYQYMILKDLGIGIDLSFEQKSTMINLDFTDPVTSNIENYDASYKVTKIKALARFSWEFYNTEKITLNFANSIGFRNVSREWQDDHSQIKYILNDYAVTKFRSSIPIAIRSAVGARIFIVENFAFHGEFGAFGGGWLLCGVSAKL